MDFIRQEWEESPFVTIAVTVVVLALVGWIVSLVARSVGGGSGNNENPGRSGPGMGSSSASFEYPLSAFRSGQSTGVMSKPQFLGDILTLTRHGDGFQFQSDTMNGSVTKGYADKWKLEVFREGNERQSIEYDSWGDLSYKLNQYMVGARYFVVNLHGNVFRVGNVSTGPVRKIKSGVDDFVTDIDKAN